MKLYESGFKGMLFRLPHECINRMNEWTPMQYQLLCSILATLPKGSWVSEARYGLIASNSGLPKTSCRENLNLMVNPPFIKGSSIIKKGDDDYDTIMKWSFTPTGQFDLLPQWICKLSGQLIKLYIVLSKWDSERTPSCRSLGDAISVSPHNIKEYIRSLLDNPYGELSSRIKDVVSSMDTVYKEEEPEVEENMQAAKLEKMLPQLWKAASLPESHTFVDWYKIAYQMVKKGVEIQHLGVIFKKLRDLPKKPKSPSYLLEMHGNRMNFEILGEIGKPLKFIITDTGLEGAGQKAVENLELSMGLSDQEYARRSRLRKEKGLQ